MFVIKPVTLVLVDVIYPFILTIKNSYTHDSVQSQFDILYSQKKRYKNLTSQNCLIYKAWALTFQHGRVIKCKMLYQKYKMLSGHKMHCHYLNTICWHGWTTAIFRSFKRKKSVKLSFVKTIIFISMPFTWITVLFLKRFVTCFFFLNSFQYAYYTSKKSQFMKFVIDM